MTTVFAIGDGDMGVAALYLFILWLISSAAAAWLAERKGYGQKPGLAAGLLLSAVGALLWVFWPARRDSKWKLQGWFRNKSGKTVAEARAEMADSVDG
jgi:fucose permease